MPILEFALKEIMLIKSSWQALALTFLYPIVIVISISLAFSQVASVQSIFGATGIEQSPVYVAVLGNQSTFDRNSFIAEIQKTGYFNLQIVGSTEEIIKAIKFRKTQIGMVITPAESQNTPAVIDLYFDNSSVIASQILLGMSQGAINRYAYNRSVSTITSIFSRLENIKESIVRQKTGLDEFQKKLDESEKQIRELQSKFDLVDFSQINSDLSDFESNHAYYKAEIASTRSEIQQSIAEIDSYYADLESAEQELLKVSSELKQIRTLLVQVRDQSQEPQKSQVSSLISDIDTEIGKIDSAIAKINQAKKDILEGKQKLVTADAKLASVSSELDAAKQKVSSAKNIMQRMQENLLETKAIFANALQAKKGIDEKILETKQQMDLFEKTLEEIISFDPDFLINPIVVRNRKMFLDKQEFAEKEKLAVITPISIAIVLFLSSILLTAISTVSERKQGVAFRVMNAPVRKSSWLLGKILGQLFFSLLVSLTIIAVAILAFQVPIIGSLLDLFLAVIIISFSFISLALFITNFTQEYSTSILASLLVMVPMFFLSGVVFPTSFMPRIIGLAAEVLPLTVANNMLSGIIVKGLPILEMAPETVTLVVPSIALIMLSIVKRDI